MLYNDLKKANVVAMKSRDRVAHEIINMITGDNKLQEQAKQTETGEPEDAQVIQTIQKMLKGLSEEIEAFTNAKKMEKVVELKHQKEVLESFLPKMLSETEIKKIIESLQDKSIPCVMKYFKEHYNGACDMKLVNKVTREFN